MKWIKSKFEIATESGKRKVSGFRWKSWCIDLREKDCLGDPISKRWVLTHWHTGLSCAESRTRPTIERIAADFNKVLDWSQVSNQGPSDALLSKLSAIKEEHRKAESRAARA